MLISIRRGVFETNSSSTHSLTIASKEEFDAWERGELLFNEWSEKFIKKEDSEEDSEGLVTYEEYFDDYSLEGFEDRYTTKSGDEIVAFGKYGYDG